MAHGILIKNRVAAMSVDSYNRSAIYDAATALDNGWVVRLDTQSSTANENEVWAASYPSGSALDDVWMLSSPEVVITTSGANKYKGIDPDPRSFTNTGSMVFDAFKLQKGDVITLSADAISGSPSTGTFVAVTSGCPQLQWTTGAGTGSSLSVGQSAYFRMLGITYISVGTGAIDTQRVLAYKLQCLRG